jgi:hypothetical protein
MSTSPDDFKKQGLITEPGHLNFKQLLPIKGLVLGSASLAGIILLVVYWEVVWEILREVVPLALETGEEALDSIFELLGLSPTIAQMATAYTGFVLVLVSLYFVLRKSITVSRKAKERASAYREAYASVGKQWWEAQRGSISAWWGELDWFQKFAAGGALLLIGIPLALLVSFILGSIVAMFL